MVKLGDLRGAEKVANLYRLGRFSRSRGCFIYNVSFDPEAPVMVPLEPELADEDD